MRPPILGIVWVLSVSFLCYAESPKVPEKYSTILRNEKDFRDVSSKKQLPDSIVKFCADHDGRLAEPGEKWQAGCIVDETPSSRLIWAVTNDEYFVVHYERGGYAHVYQVLVVRVKPNAKVDVIWDSAYVDGRIKNYASFLSKYIESEPAQDKTLNKRK